MKDDRLAKRAMYHKTSKIEEDMGNTGNNEIFTPTQDLKPTGKIVSKMTRDETNKFLLYNLAYSTYLTKQLKECSPKLSEDSIDKRTCFFWLDELKNDMIEQIAQAKIQEQKQLTGKKQKLATTSGTEKKSFFSCCCPSKKETITYKKK